MRRNSPVSIISIIYTIVCERTEEIINNLEERTLSAVLSPTPRMLRASLNALMRLGWFRSARKPKASENQGKHFKMGWYSHF
jgi:hypothetical protein